MRTPRARFLVLVFASAAAAARAQSPPPAAPGPGTQQTPETASARLDRLQVWVDAVERHQPGTVDLHIRRVSAWSRDDLLWVMRDARNMISLARDPSVRIFFDEPPARAAGPPRQIMYRRAELKQLERLAMEIAPDPNAVLVRGALLHTDVAILGDLSWNGSARSPSGPTSLRFNDGREVGRQSLSGHLDAARALLDRVTPAGQTRPDPTSSDAVRLWYRATLAYQQYEVQIDVKHVVRAQALFPADANVQFLAGTLHETLATEKVQSAVESSGMRREELGLATARGELGLAADALRDALRANPDLAEARLHYGNVLGLQGHHVDARAELGRALSGVGENSSLAYCARMLAGREAEAVNRAAEARESYIQASRLFPRAPSPLLALSQLARRSGEGRAAIEGVERMLAVPVTNETDDPWWTYHTSPGRNVDLLFATLRAQFPVRQP